MPPAVEPIELVRRRIAANRARVAEYPVAEIFAKKRAPFDGYRARRTNAAVDRALALLEAERANVEREVSRIVGVHDALLAEIERDAATLTRERVNAMLGESNTLRMRPAELVATAEARAEREVIADGHDLILFIGLDLQESGINPFREKQRINRGLALKQPAGFAKLSSGPAPTAAAGTVAEYGMRGPAGKMTYLEVNLAPEKLELDGADVAEFVGRLTPHSKIFLVGHGSPESTTISSDKRTKKVVNGVASDWKVKVDLAQFGRNLGAALAANPSCPFRDPATPLQITLYPCFGAGFESFDGHMTVGADGKLLRQDGSVVGPETTLAGRVLAALRAEGIFARIKAKTTSVLVPRADGTATEVVSHGDAVLDGLSARAHDAGYQQHRIPHAVALLDAKEQGIGHKYFWRLLADGAAGKAVRVTFTPENPDATLYAEVRAERSAIVASDAFQGKTHKVHGYKRVFDWDGQGRMRCVDASDGREVDVLFEINKDRAITLVLAAARQIRPGADIQLAVQRFDALMALTLRLEKARDRLELARLLGDACQPMPGARPGARWEWFEDSDTGTVLKSLADELARDVNKLLPCAVFWDSMLGVRHQTLDTVEEELERHERRIVAFAEDALFVDEEQRIRGAASAKIDAAAITEALQALDDGRAALALEKANAVRRIAELRTTFAALRAKVLSDLQAIEARGRQLLPDGSPVEDPTATEERFKALEALVGATLDLRHEGRDACDALDRAAAAAIASAEARLTERDHDFILVIALDFDPAELGPLRARFARKRKLGPATSTPLTMVRGQATLPAGTASVQEMHGLETSMLVELNLSANRAGVDFSKEIANVCARLTERSKVVVIAKGNLGSTAVSSGGHTDLTDAAGKPRRDADGRRAVATHDARTLGEMLGKALKKRPDSPFRDPNTPLAVSFYTSHAAGLPLNETVVVRNGAVLRSITLSIRTIHQLGATVHVPTTREEDITEAIPAARLLRGLKDQGIYARVKAKTTALIPSEGGAPPQAGAGNAAEGIAQATRARDVATAVGFGKRYVWKVRGGQPNGPRIVTFTDVNPAPFTHDLERTEVAPPLERTQVQSKTNRVHGLKRVFEWGPNDELVCRDVSDPVGTAVDFVFELNKDRAVAILLAAAARISSRRGRSTATRIDGLLPFATEFEGATTRAELIDAMQRASASPAARQHYNALGFGRTGTQKILQAAHRHLRDRPNEPLPMPDRTRDDLGL